MQLCIVNINITGLDTCFLVQVRGIWYISGGVARFTRVLFELPCYPQFELEIHIVEVSYFTNILIKLSGLWWSTLFYRLLQRS